MSPWIDITPVTTRQHFQPASPPPVSSHTQFFLSPPDIFNSRVDFSSDDSSRTRHFQKVPQTCFQTATSFYFTSANTTTRLPLDGSCSPKSRPDLIQCSSLRLFILQIIFRARLLSTCKRNQLPLPSPLFSRNLFTTLLSPAG